MHSAISDPNTRTTWNWIKTLTGLLKPYGKQVILGLGLVAAIDVIEIFVPYLFKLVLDHLQGVDQRFSVLSLAFLLLVIHLIQGPMRFAWRVLIVPSSHGASATLRKKFHAELMRKGVPYSESVSTGEVITLMNSDIEAIRMFLGPGLIVAVDSIAYLVTIFIAMGLIGGVYGLAIFPPMFAIPFLVRYFERRLKNGAREVQDSLSKSASMGQAWIEGVRVLRTKYREHVALKLYEGTSKDLRAERLKYNRLQSLFHPSMDLVLSISLLSLMFFSEQLFSKSSGTATAVFSIGTVFALSRYLQKCVWPLSAAALAVEHFQRAQVSYERLESFYKTQIQEIPKNTVPVIRIKKSDELLSLSKVEFSYPHGKQLFQFPDFEVRPGEWIFLDGRNGSGKSTLFKILMKHFYPQSGHIFLDGKDYALLDKQDVRSVIASVDQESQLLAGSIRSNLTGFDARPLPAAGQVESLLSSSGLFLDFYQNRLSFKTEVGFRGTRLSGGQRQRVSIARALHKKPKILLLDDVSSSLDAETEEMLLREVKKNVPDLACILVSQRPFMASLADRSVCFSARPKFIARENQESVRVF